MTKPEQGVGIRRLTLAAMFLALGIVLPLFFGQIPQIGSMLLPMHIPVFLCALICGYRYGVPVAVILPLLRSVVFSRPNMFPEAIAIACEMATYAFVADFLYSRSKWHCIKALYRCLLAAMLVGRVVRTAVQLALLGLSGSPIAFRSYLTGTLLAGIPGVILQLIVIPAIMVVLHRTKLMPPRRKNKDNSKNSA